MRHSNAELLERLFGAFGRDVRTLAELLAEDVVWRVPGETVMSGEHRGRDDVLRFLRGTRANTGDSYRSDFRYAVADDEHGVAVYRARGERAGRSLDIDQALFCRFANGQIVDVTAIPFDFPAFAEFWS